MISFFYTGEWYSIVYMCQIFTVHSSGEGHLGCFNLLVIVIRAAVHMAEQVSMEEDVESFGHILKSGKDGSYRFLVFRDPHAHFQSSCSSLQLHQQRMQGPFSPYPL